MKYKEVIKFYFLLLLLLPIFLIIAIYVYDPLQIYHKSWISEKLRLHKNMRLQASGIINNYQFDSMLLGTCMLQNSSSLDASQKFGGNFVNMSLSGADFYERNYILNYALKKKKIKRVIYSLDSYYLSQRTGDKEYPVSTFSYLYDNNIFNNMKVYWNDKFLSCLGSMSLSEKCIGKENSLDQPNNFMKLYGEEYRGFGKWLNDASKMSIISELDKKYKKIDPKEEINHDIEKEFLKAKEYIDKYIFGIVSKHQTTEFIFFFPPYARIKTYTMLQKNSKSFNIHKKIVKYMAYEGSKYKNMKLFAFGDRQFLDNLNNYLDFEHYTPNINTLMLNDFAENKGLLTIQNVDAYLRKMTHNVYTYDTTEYKNRIRDYLKNKH